MRNWLAGKVVDNIHWTDTLFSLKIDADVDNFSAGQFASLALDIDGERVARPYSYLSAPHERPLEFYFYTATGGKLSNALVNLGPGDEVWVTQQANGFFTLDEVPQARDLWMIGTGTGIAPFLSILKTPRPWEKFEHIVLVQGVRTLEDLQYRDVVDSFSQQYPQRFSFQPFISRERVPGTLYGRVPAAIESGLLQSTVGREMSIDHSQFMLCGNPDMVKDVSELLKQRGFLKNLRRKPGHITTENYW